MRARIRLATLGIVALLTGGRAYELDCGASIPSTGGTIGAERPMGMTIIEKILARRARLAKVSPGDLVVVDVDVAMLIDNAFFPSGWREVLAVVHPERVVVVFDHRAPAPDR